MYLHEAEKGREVLYTPYIGCPESIKEKGIITSVNHKFVFVRYNPAGYGIATRPEDIEYI
jgi:hypothetical protein